MGDQGQETGVARRVEIRLRRIGVGIKIQILLILMSSQLITTLLFQYNQGMSSVFGKKENKMVLSAIQHSKLLTIIQTPSTPTIPESCIDLRDLSIKSQCQLDQSLVSGYTDFQSIFNKNSRVVDQISTHFLYSSGNSDVSFRSETQQLNKSTDHRLKEPKRQVRLVQDLKELSSLQLDRKKFKREFIEEVQKYIFSVSNSGSIDKLLQGFRKLQLSHPFIEHHHSYNTPILSLETLMDLWINQLEEFSKLILTFDFILSHAELIFSLFFYYSQVATSLVCPLVSMREECLIEKEEQQLKINIFKILIYYIQYRSRDLVRHGAIFRVLIDFYDHMLKTVINHKSETLSLIERSKESLVNLNRYQLCVIQKFMDGKGKFVVNSESSVKNLEQIRINYEEKDKFIRDEAKDIADLFNLVAKRRFMMNSLGFYYDTMDEDEDFKGTEARRMTCLNNWLLKILISKCHSNGYLAWDYLTRFFQICRSFYHNNNLQSLLLFTSILLNIKEYLPCLWMKFVKQKLINADQELTLMINYYQNLKISHNNVGSDQVVIFEYVKINKIVESLKLKYKSQNYMSIKFHQNLQDFAQKITKYRRVVERDLMENERRGKIIKGDMNYRFMSHYIYEYLNKTVPRPEQQFEKLKVLMREVDHKIYYPFKFF